MEINSGQEIGTIQGTEELISLEIERCKEDDESLPKFVNTNDDLLAA